MLIPTQGELVPSVGEGVACTEQSRNMLLGEMDVAGRGFNKNFIFHFEKSFPLHRHILFFPRGRMYAYIIPPLLRRVKEKRKISQKSALLSCFSPADGIGQRRFHGGAADLLS